MASDSAVEPAAPTYLEDFRVGQRFTSRSYLIDAAEIKEFAAKFDPQPFHLDEAAAVNSYFQGLAASGWHTAGITMRLMVECMPKTPGGLLGAGGEITWPRATRPGDELHVACEIVGVRESRSKPDRGLVTFCAETLNQAGEPVQVFKGTMVAWRRIAATDS